MSEFKSCLFCKYCDFTAGGWLSDQTHESASIDCDKHFHYAYPGNKQSVREFSNRANTCPDYEVEK